MRLDVLIEGQYAGHVDIAGQDGATFTYAPEYLALASPTPLSTTMPLRGKPYSAPAVAYWLRNLLPDDDDVLDAWCLEHRISLLRPIELLGTPVGAECAGAVQLCPPQDTAELLDARGGIESLTEDKFWEDMAKLKANPAFRFSSAYGARGKSLGGMQPKDALVAVGDGWAVPWGASASTHILKLDRDKYPHETIVEHVTMSTAARLGLPVAPTRLLYGDSFNVIVVKRYDRRGTDHLSKVQRVHQEDLCQALALSPTRKYQYAPGGPTASRCVSALSQPDSAETARDIARLGDMLLFRWLVGDTDGHAKNFSILLSGDRRALAPLYDSATFLPHRGETKEPDLILAMWGGPSGKVWHLRQTDTTRSLRLLAKALGANPAALGARAEQLGIALPDAFDATINTLTVKDQTALDGLATAARVRRRSTQCAAVAADLVGEVTSGTGRPNAALSLDIEPNKSLDL